MSPVLCTLPVLSASPSAPLSSSLSPGAGAADVSGARDCIGQTFPKFAKKLRYPADAEAHFQQLHATLREQFPLCMDGSLDFANEFYHNPQHVPDAVCMPAASDGTPVCYPAYEKLFRTDSGLGGALELPPRNLRRVFGGFVPLFVDWMSCLYLGQLPSLLTALDGLLQPTTP